MRNPFKTGVVEMPVVAPIEQDEVINIAPLPKENPFADGGVNAEGASIDAPSEVAQVGVQKIEAITAVLNRKHLIAVYVL